MRARVRADPFDRARLRVHDDERSRSGLEPAALCAVVIRAGAHDPVLQSLLPDLLDVGVDVELERVSL